MTHDPNDMETLAAVEHDSWANWTRYMLREIVQAIEEMNPDLEVAEWFDDLPCVKRWDCQCKSPYADLSEKEKESDRDVVRQKLPFYRPHGPDYWD